MSGKRAPKEAARCIFCEGPRPGFTMSKEHLWSDWMGDIIPNGFRRIEVLETFADPRSPIGEIKAWRRPGGTHTIKMRVVCNECNSEWMSRLETAAKVFIEPMMRGRPLMLTEDSLRVIASWVALKNFIYENDRTVGEPALPTFSQPIRTQFMRDHIPIPPNYSVPLGYKMWMGHPAGPRWYNSAMRYSGNVLLSRTPLDPGNLPPAPIRARNIQSMTWGVFHLLFYVIGTTDPDLHNAIGWETPKRVAQLWPLRGGPIYWGPAPTMSDAEIEDIAGTLKRLTDQPFELRPKK